MSQPPRPDAVWSLDDDEAADLRARLLADLPEIPSRYLYDDRGSELFEQITDVPEYYQTRTELGILEARADAIIADAGARSVAELGSGAGRKIGLLIEALERAGGCDEVVQFDINATFVAESVKRLQRAWPGVDVRGVVGTFTRDLDRLGPGGHRLVVLFGGTIGNFPPHRTVPFLAGLAERMAPTDRLLIGFDLVKDPGLLHAAYNDQAGVTAAFNRNILRNLNRATGADFVPERFEHVAFYDADNAWIEMRLRATEAMTVHVPAIEATLHLDAGDEVRTEISCKYTRSMVQGYAAEAGLGLAGWYTDPDDLFALGLLRPEPA